jgi:LysR family glycine cleavage system transcriptional activator
MAIRMPPLSALRAFEAAARHESFAEAAYELCVTPGAISRQIKTLEDHLGINLFERGHRKVTLSPEARVYGQMLKEVFERIQIGTRRLASQGRNRPLHIVCPITFATRWLIPHIPSFTAVAPEVQIRLTTAVSLVRNLTTITDADVSIEYRKESIPGFESHPLTVSRLVPVCSPTMAQRLKNPADLHEAVLLHSSTRRSGWIKWANAAGVADLDTSTGMEFSSLALAYQAAVEGVGVAIGDLDLVKAEIETGQLVIPFGPVVQTQDQYTLMYPLEFSRDERILKFRDWILDLVAREGRSGIDVARLLPQAA